MGMIKIPESSIQFFKQNIDEIFDSGFLAEGKWNKELSTFIKNMTGAKFAIPTNSNGAGMVALLDLYRFLHKREKVLLQSNTMYGVKTMVYAAGCSLTGYINSQIETLMPSYDDVKEAISTFTKEERKQLIILLSHIGGIINPDIEKISNLCVDEDIILLEDCAHSFGATLSGKHSGLFGNAGVYSFYATKAIPAGEGGVVVTNDEELGQLINDFSIYDRFKQELKIGFNNRISEPQALLTYSIVKEWKSIIENKTEIAQKYIKVCEDLGINYIAQNKDGQNGNYYKFTIYNENIPISEFLPLLKTKTSPVYDYSIGVENPVAGYHACLPIWYGQEEEITETVVMEIRQNF